MMKILRAEHLKTGRSMGRALIWAFPVSVFALAFILTLGMTNAYAESVWNWWYTLLLPGMLAISCHLSMMREKKIKYYHLLTLSTGKRKLMIGKIIYMGCVVLISNMIIFAGAFMGGILLTTSVPVEGALTAVLVLTITQLWEIPLFLFLSERFGMVVELLVCLFLTVFGIILASTDKWFCLASAIPMRILCPLLHILPNGIRAEEGNPLLNMNAIFPGICISLFWFILAAILFLKWFDNRD